jgi:hypothetical protein
MSRQLLRNSLIGRASAEGMDIGSNPFSEACTRLNGP